MHGIILAGGLGTRLRSAVPNRPKCLAPVDGDRCFLDVQLESLRTHGVSRITLSLGYAAEQVIALLPRFSNILPVDYVVETEPLGTGGAILATMSELDVAEAIITNGDTFIDAPLSEIIFKPLAKLEAMRMTVMQVPNCARYGGVLLDPERRVVGFAEKREQGSGLVNAGCYRVRRSAIEKVSEGQKRFSLEDVVLPALARAGGLHASLVNGNFIDIGVPEDYERFCRAFGRKSRAQSDFS
jgi:D-glycero-alpha-D-manno-heptose 1-phosphate guanylyltransferase